MKRMLGAVLLIAVFTTSSRAASKDKIFGADIDSVWDACVQAANSQFTLEHSEKASHALSFKSGTSATSWGFDVGVSLVKISDKKTRVILNPQKRRLQLAWGAGGRIADKYFDAVQKSLAELASQPPEGDSRK